MIDAGVKIYREQVREDENGGRPLYRRRNGDIEEKNEKKKSKRNFWKNKKEKRMEQGREEEGGIIRMPIMVPFTVGGGLIKR